MLLQTNSYVVPRDRKAEHTRLVRRFRQTFARIGCDSFEVYEQVGANWSAGESSGRYVQIMRFRDRRHQLAVQEAERNDPDAQELIAEFCDMINFPYQRQQGLFAVGFYIGVLPNAPHRQPELVDKSFSSEAELEEDPAPRATSATARPTSPAKPAALVEPGAATRSPIIPPVEPGQVPIITPAPGDLAETEAQPPVEADSPIPAEADEHAVLADEPQDEFAELAAEPDAPAQSAEEPTMSTAPDDAPTAPTWQTSDEIAEELTIDPAEITDVDETGEVRVADPDLLKAEADFAEYTKQPHDAFEELKGKPPVLQGTLVDDGYLNGSNSDMLDDDDALAALELNGDSSSGKGQLTDEDLLKMAGDLDPEPLELPDPHAEEKPASETNEIRH